MNKVILQGRLTKDIELSKTQSGKSFARFTIAVNRRKKEDGTQEADFINCVTWEQRAEALYNYVGKGNRILVEGSITTGKYNNKQGQTIYTTDVAVEKFDFIDFRNQEQPQYQQPQVQTQPEETYHEPIIDISNDDLPF